MSWKTPNPSACPCRCQYLFHNSYLKTHLQMRRVEAFDEAFRDRYGEVHEFSAEDLLYEHDIGQVPWGEGWRSWIRPIAATSEPYGYEPTPEHAFTPGFMHTFYFPLGEETTVAYRRKHSHSRWELVRGQYRFRLEAPMPGRYRFRWREVTVTQYSEPGVPDNWSVVFGDIQTEEVVAGTRGQVIFTPARTVEPPASELTATFLAGPPGLPLGFSARRIRVKFDRHHTHRAFVQAPGETPRFFLRMDASGGFAGAPGLPPKAYSGSYRWAQYPGYPDPAGQAHPDFSPDVFGATGWPNALLDWSAAPLAGPPIDPARATRDAGYSVTDESPTRRVYRKTILGPDGQPIPDEEALELSDEYTRQMMVAAADAEVARRKAAGSWSWGGYGGGTRALAGWRMESADGAAYDRADGQIGLAAPPSAVSEETRYLIPPTNDPQLYPVRVTWLETAFRDGAAQTAAREAQVYMAHGLFGVERPPFNDWIDVHVPAGAAVVAHGIEVPDPPVWTCGGRFIEVAAD